MKSPIDAADFRYNGKGKLQLKKWPTDLKKRLYPDKDNLKEQLRGFQEAINERQEQMYAQDRYAMLLVFQAMDAAGKDGTIQHVMSGISRSNQGNREAFRSISRGCDAFRMGGQSANTPKVTLPGNAVTLRKA